VPSIKQQVANATGFDEVPAKLFKAKGETVLDRMHRICVAILEASEWPEEWTFSTFIPLPKKGDLKQCTNYITIALDLLTCWPNYTGNSSLRSK